jgi:hypothetical protein
LASYSVGENKNPYVQGWQNKPHTPQEIEVELSEGLCKAVGLISGPAYNKPYGHVWLMSMAQACIR